MIPVSVASDLVTPIPPTLASNAAHPVATPVIVTPSVNVIPPVMPVLTALASDSEKTPSGPENRNDTRVSSGKVQCYIYLYKDDASMMYLIY